MQLLLRTLTIFLGTLIAAALVALGEPVLADLRVVGEAAPGLQRLVALLDDDD